MKPRFLAVALLAVPLLLGTRLTPPAAGSRYAFVDMARLIREHDESSADQTAVSQWNNETLRGLEAKSAELAAQLTELEAFEPGSPDHQRATQSLDVERFRLKVKQEAHSREFDTRLRAALERSHARVVAACNRYREEHGLGAVLQVQAHSVQAQSREELVSEILMRAVVAYDPALDATDAIMELLNR